MAGSPGGQEVGRVSVRVVPDTSRFREELEAYLSRTDPEEEVDLVLDENGFRAKLEALTAKDAKVKVKTELDQKSMSMQVADMFNKIPTPNFGSGVNPAGFALIGVGLMATIAPALGLITTALAALPGLAAAIATPIAAITLGLDGMKKSLEVLKPGFEQLKTTMNGVNEQAFAPVFETLARVFPSLEKSLPTVSQGLADMAQSFASTITAPGNLAKIESTIGNIGTALSTAAPGVGSFTGGLVNLANSLSQKFPAVAQWFSDAGAGFDTFIQKIIDNGDLSGAFEGLGGSLKTVLDTVTNLGKQGLDFMGDPAKVERMQTAFSNIATSVEKIGEGSAGFFSLLDRIENSSQNRELEDKGVLSFLKEGFDLDNLFGKDSAIDHAGVQRFQDAFDPDNLFGKDKGWGDFTKQAGDILGNVNEWLSSPFAKIVDFFKNTVGVGMASAAADTGPQIGGALGQSIQQGLQNATSGGLGAGAGQGLLGTDQIQGAVQQIQGQLAQLGPQVQAAVQAAIVPIQQIPAQIQQAFSGIGAAVTGSMANVVSSVAGGGQQIVAAFTASLSQIPGIAVNAFNAVSAAAAAGMANVVAQISNGAAQAVASVQSMAQQIVAALQQAAAGARAAGAQIGAGMAAGIRESTGAAVAAAQALASAVTAAAQTNLGIKSPSRVFAEIGDNVGKGLSQGIEGQSSDVVATVRSVLEQIKAVFGDASGLNLNFNFGQVQSTMESIASTAQSIPKDLSTTALSPTGSTKMNAETRAMLDQIEIEKDRIELQRQQLQAEKNATGDKGAKAGLQQQIDELGIQKQQLELQRQQLSFQGKYTESVAGTTDQYKDLLKTATDIPLNFATANGQQLMQDLGIGGGAITAALGEAGNFARTALGNIFNISVGSVDDAIAVKNNQLNKEALTYTRP